MFVLHAIDARHGACGLAQQRVKTDRRRVGAVLNGDLDAIGKLRQRHGNFRKSGVKLGKSLFAGKKNRSLQFRSGFGGEAARFTEVTRSTGRCRGEPGIGV